MKNLRAKITAVGSLFIILAFASAASAQQRNQARAGMRDDAAIGIQIRQFIQGLRLSETQRGDINAILQAHKTEILEARRALLNARLALAKEDPNAPGLFGAAQTRLMELRLQILSQVKSKLTADQLDVLRVRQQRQADRIQNLLNRLNN